MVQMVNQSEYFVHVTANSSASVHMSMLIGTLNQSHLTTPPYPVSIKFSKAFFPSNLSLSLAPSLTVHNIDNSHIHCSALPTITDLQPMKNTYISEFQYQSHSEARSLHYNDSTNITELQAWVLKTILLH